jgi:hypothetical protein
MKKVFSKITIVLVLLTLLPVNTLAKWPVSKAADHGKGALVALGDSISFGYNLENNNHHVSRDAFPSLMGEEADLRVRNLGEPGWTTALVRSFKKR